MEAIDSDPMDSDPDAVVFGLRAELFELLDEMKELKYSCADDVARFLETTHDDEAHALIPKLRKKKVRMQLLKTRLIETSKNSSFAQSLMGSAPPFDASNFCQGAIENSGSAWSKRGQTQE
jgi:hypothetical protein